MNAYQRGREEGFAYKMTIIGGSKAHFEAVGKNASAKAYKTPAKQKAYLEGWMENWQEPHAADCQCAACEDIRSIIIETY